ncbi:MAG TPA: hypothetical protein VI653_00785 [Steroidobacteraceae bacterium]
MHALQQPMQAERLLEAIIVRANILPKGSYRVRHPEALPDTLQRVMFNAAQEGRICISWARGVHIWLFTCEPPVPAGPERRASALDVKVYGESGNLVAAGAWMLDAEGKWERCVA